MSNLWFELVYTFVFIQCDIARPSVVKTM